MRTCTIEGCERVYYSRNLCSLHYQRAKANNPDSICKIEDCTNSVTAHGKCDKHYRRSLRAGLYGGKECQVSTCNGKARALGYCQPHYHINRKYDIDPEIYLEKLNEQDDACAICRVKYEKLFVDHDHATGEVRGLLCRECNSGIGFLKDSIDNAISAAEYLKKWRP